VSREFPAGTLGLDAWREASRWFTSDVAAIDSYEAGDPRASVDLGGFEQQPNSPVGRLVRGENLIHIPDLMELAPRVPEDPVPRAAVELGRAHTADGAAAQGSITGRDCRDAAGGTAVLRE
jgi:hypothetical protein